MKIYTELQTERARVAHETMPIADAVCQTLSDWRHSKDNDLFCEANNLTSQQLENDYIVLLGEWAEQRQYD